jgi:hypothetical protein
VTYSDRRFFTGKIYETLGFRFVDITPCGYYYIINKYKDLRHRMSFQKHKLKNFLNVFDPNLSEWEKNSFSKYNLNGSEIINLTERLNEYSNNYWPIWVLHRTSNYMNMLNETIKYKTPHFREIFMGLKTLSQGFCKKKYCQYLIRGIHDNRFHFEELNKINLTPNFLNDKKLLEFFLQNEIKSIHKDIIINGIIHKFTNSDKILHIDKSNQNKLVRNLFNKVINVLYYYSFKKDKSYKIAKKLYLIKNI